jgi:hypothetical protein
LLVYARRQLLRVGWNWFMRCERKSCAVRLHYRT